MGCSARSWGALRALEGSRAPLQPPQWDAQATPEPLHGNLLGGEPQILLGGALLHPAWGGHPTPRSVLLLLKPPLHLMDTGSAQSYTSPTISLAPGWIQKWLPMRWGRAELLPSGARGAGGSKERDPRAGHGLSLQRCPGEGAGMACAVAWWQEGVPVPWRAVVSNPCLCSHGACCPLQCRRRRR